MAFRIASLFLPALVLGASSAMAAPASLEGRWKTEDGRAAVQFYPCGQALCGRISDLLAPEPQGGARDTKNPKKELRDRKLQGLRIFWNLSADGSSWEGKGYSPQDGRYFNATLTPDGNRMKLKGCVAVFCKSQTWTKIG